MFNYIRAKITAHVLEYYATVVKFCMYFLSECAGRFAREKAQIREGFRAIH